MQTSTVSERYTPFILFLFLSVTLLTEDATGWISPQSSIHSVILNFGFILAGTLAYLFTAVICHVDGCKGQKLVDNKDYFGFLNWAMCASIGFVIVVWETRLAYASVFMHR